MKPKLLALSAMVIGLALSTTTLAQRHNEKPHGTGKAGTESVDKERTPGGSGRHDEKPHGTKKAVRKTDGATTKSK